MAKNNINQIKIRQVVLLHIIRDKRSIISSYPNSWIMPDIYNFRFSNPTGAIAKPG